MLVEAVEIHDKLNPKIWDDATASMLPEVREACTKIVDEFLEGLEKNDIPIRVVDVWVVGSNASYNYNENSDLDIHIIADTSRASNNPLLLSLLYNYYKSSFNSNYDISVHGVNVELYIEDVNTTSISDGIYSLKYGVWERVPDSNIKLEYEGDIENSLIFKKLLADYNDAVAGYKDPDNVIDYLYMLRKLDMQQGSQYGERNLAFKEFRRLGYLDKLKELSRQNTSQKLTLEELGFKKGERTHSESDLDEGVKESAETSPLPDRPSAQDSFRYHWELESRAIKRPEDLLRKFKSKYPNQYDTWGETFEWMLEHNEESFVEPQNYALYLEYDLDTSWGYIAIVEFKGRYQESLKEVYPQKDETKSDFINRFMRVTVKEYPDVKQRYAVANSYWDNRTKKDLKEDMHDKAVAIISGSPDHSEIEGRVVFTQKGDTVRVNVNLINLPQSRFLGFHIHSGSECSGDEQDPFKDAKMHFNPSRKSHPEHAGDLPALYSSNGCVNTAFETDRFTVSDIIGKTLIIHSDRDDFTSQPAGDAGDKIACGVIKSYTLDEAYLDSEEKFWDYRTKDISENQYIDTTRNEIRWVDDLLDDPDYYERKGYTARVVEMTPEEYFEYCAELFGNSVEIQKRQIASDTDVIDNLTQVITKYKKRFPIPFINIVNKSQEGRHRMYVLGELFGWDKRFPVLVIQDVNNVRVPGKKLK